MAAMRLPEYGCPIAMQRSPRNLKYRGASPAAPTSPRRCAAVLGAPRPGAGLCRDEAARRVFLILRRRAAARARRHWTEADDCRAVIPAFPPRHSRERRESGGRRALLGRPPPPMPTRPGELCQYIAFHAARTGFRQLSLGGRGRPKLGGAGWARRGDATEIKRESRAATPSPLTGDG